MSIHFTLRGNRDLLQAFSYYEGVREGLGFEFRDEVDLALSRIEQYPSGWTTLSKRTRLCRTKRFPYGLIYSVIPGEIRIIAVVHLQSDPKSWPIN